MRQLWVVAFLVMMGAPVACLADETEYFDGEFQNSHWIIINHEIGFGGGSSAQQILTGGAPDEYREVDVWIDAGDGERRVFSFNLNQLAKFDPSDQGPINAIDYYESTMVSKPGQTIGIGLEQGGDLYNHGIIGTQDSTVWISTAAVGLTADDFKKAIEGGWDTLSHPDFSRNGSIITLGFYRGHGHPGSGDYHLSSGGIDNWRLVVHHTPSVPTLSLRGLTILLLLLMVAGIRTLWH